MSLTTWIKNIIMRKAGNSITLIRKATQSSRLFRSHELGPEYSPLIEPPSSDDKGAVLTTP